ncbi:hypothetical protein EDD18DRAFT_1334454 [Armillaria luteobubalina]|uniref:Uncharacterized protein n=1 Tax=Armillaria luteobubalina TaxID=153913 RepID=A0AA39UJN2_9AGAR|nr:hypothetical protein EDD18DRAFT_1334454 [Armillaria luteobubalina]
MFHVLCGIFLYVKRRYGTTVVLDSPMTPPCLHDGTAPDAVDLLQYKSTSEDIYLITGTFGSFGIIAFNAGSPTNYTKFEVSVGTPAVAYTFEPCEFIMKIKMIILRFYAKQSVLDVPYEIRHQLGRLSVASDGSDLGSKRSELTQSAQYLNTETACIQPTTTIWFDDEYLHRLYWANHYRYNALSTVSFNGVGLAPLTMTRLKTGKRQKVFVEAYESNRNLLTSGLVNDSIGEIGS